MLRVWSSISFSLSVGEGSSKFLEKSLSVVWLTRDVILVLLFAVSSATASFVEAVCELSRLRADEHRATCAKSSLPSS